MPLKWKRVWVADDNFESVGVFDVDNDGVPDIVSGAWWYQGPDFRKKFSIGEVKAYGEYYDDFSTIPMDINGDGRLDFITGGWWGNTLRWRENPQDPTKPWPEHVIAETGNIETTRAWDVDRDGRPEIVPNTPGGPLVVYKLGADRQGKGNGQFAAHKIYDQKQGHGLGFGDIAGSGRGDFVFHHGWLEAPPDPFQGEWRYHAFDKPPWWASSMPILVTDVNGDGLGDLIVGNAHGYGLDWVEQGRDAAGQRTWKRHPIDPYNAQYHDLQWVDIDGDGRCELVTGKRHRAHCGNEEGEWDDVGIYYFKWNGQSFTKNVISYGPIGERTGCGIHFALADLRGTGRLDLVAPGKGGLFVFYNEGA